VRPDAPSAVNLQRHLGNPRQLIIQGCSGNAGKMMPKAKVIGDIEGIRGQCLQECQAILLNKNNATACTSFLNRPPFL
jgi:hypothetical protein